MSVTKSLARLLAVLAAFTLIAAACGGGDDDAGSGDDGAAPAADGDLGSLSGSINVSGSSTVEPVTARAAELFGDAGAGGVEITVDGPGTGDGFKLFCSGETDISDASRQIKEAEAADCGAAGIEYVELEIAFDGIAVMTNANNDAVECLSFVDLYALLGGESDGFGRWSDASDLAAELGSTVAPFPDADLVISAPGTESGTYDSFIELVLEGLGEERLGEDADHIRTDFPGNPEDNVIIQGIAGSDTSLGWVGFAFAEENLGTVKEIAISEEPGGDCVTPTIETIADGSYPVSRSLYVYVSIESAQRPEVVAYVDYLLNEAYVEAVTRAFGESGYVPLPDIADTIAAWDAVKG